MHLFLHIFPMLAVFSTLVVHVCAELSDSLATKKRAARPWLANDGDGAAEQSGRGRRGFIKAPLSHNPPAIHNTQGAVHISLQLTGLMLTVISTAERFSYQHHRAVLLGEVLTQISILILIPIHPSAYSF